MIWLVNKNTEENAMHMRRSAGFSMIEMTIVLFIIGLILSMVGPQIAKVLLSGKETGTKSMLSAIKNAIAEYDMDLGHRPKTLQHLVQNVENNPKWKGPYLEGQTEVPADKWDNPFVYNMPPKVFKKEYKFFEIYSYGDGGEDADPATYLKQGS